MFYVYLVYNQVNCIYMVYLLFLGILIASYMMA